MSKVHSIRKVDAGLAQEFGLSSDEYERICLLLSRNPNLTELGVFSVMWSEHCCYKSSRVYLKTLPTKGEHVLQGPGENAGVVSLGGGKAAVFKIESHNHPSYIEPYQGAATGVGGIVRDIFTMGARPIALMNALRFGEADAERMPYLIENVVKGIGDYGNCIGVPTVGGETFFHSSFNGNILVNALCIGLLDEKNMMKGLAAGIGNPVVYIGAHTGRDGIHGATMASDAFCEASEEKRPTVQVGDPFTEKLLLEACMELAQSDAVIGIQDMGAAGLSCSSLEMASRGQVGLRIDLSRVPVRETGMTPYEIMLSESQERMLLVLKKGREAEVKAILSKWDLAFAVIGEVIEGDCVELFQGEKEVALLPVNALTEGAPVFHRPFEKPNHIEQMRNLNLAHLPMPHHMVQVLEKMLLSPNLCSRNWIWRQFDHTVQTNTLINPGSDAAIIRIKETGQALAISVDANSRWCYLDPYRGARLAVAESARNIACVGARPLGLTNCLNFGNPERPDIMWQFSEVIRGIKDACISLKIPVTGGNVSFYNETEHQNIYPTPVIGVLGLIDDARKAGRSYLVEEGAYVALLGDTHSDLGGSEYLWVMHGIERGQVPDCDINVELALQGFLHEAWAASLLQAAHDVSEGGVGIAFAEMCLGAETLMGLDLCLESEFRSDFMLFSETPGRAVIVFHADHVNRIEALCEQWKVPYHPVGRVIREPRLVIENILELNLETLYPRWKQAFSQLLKD